MGVGGGGGQPSRFLQISFAFGHWTYSLEWINGVCSLDTNQEYSIGSINSIRHSGWGH